MGTATSISVRALSKRYLIGERQPYERLRAVVRRSLNRAGLRDEIMALDDVTFDVPKGSVVGIIGHNGAGKSTLLRILSRVTEPTSGEVELVGRVSALLEVGTGFHPELTGRENVYLNGSILGMTRGEIAARFDDIVDFAEVAQFINTPIKRYSSGMQLRLAFAVAAFLEPEILIVDEVLAVGDVAFQRKCLGRLEAGASSGRTVLFVSHNLAAIRSLCPRSILLDHGRIVYDGPTAGAIDHYLACDRQVGTAWDLTNSARPAYEIGRRHLLCGARLLGQRTVEVGSSVQIEIEIEATGRASEIVPVVNLMTSEGEIVAQAVSATTRPPFRTDHPGSLTIRVILPEVNLQPGTYTVGFGLRSEFGLEDEVSQAGAIEITEVRGVESPVYGSTGGFLRLPATWESIDRPKPDGSQAPQHEGLD